MLPKFVFQVAEMHDCQAATANSDHWLDPELPMLDLPAKTKCQRSRPAFGGATPT